MKQIAKKSVLGLVIAGLMSSSLAIKPAEARSHSGRDVAIGVAVVAVIALIVGHHKHHKEGTTTTTTMAPTSTTTTGTATATP